MAPAVETMCAMHWELAGGGRGVMLPILVMKLPPAACDSVSAFSKFDRTHKLRPVPSPQMRDNSRHFDTFRAHQKVTKVVLLGSLSRQPKHARVMFFR